MDELQVRTLEGFASRFGGRPDLATSAPGRVNLIGEHTDYNDGFVLPMAIGWGTIIAARARGDGVINLVAADFGFGESRFDTSHPIQPDTAAPWSNYIRGVAHALREDGVAITGADIMIAGNVPRGAGLSSSASLEVAAGLALVSLAGQPDYNRTRLALAGQRAEHEFAGCKCGIMDQLVSARGVAGHALLIDCRTLETAAARMPDDATVMIVHSGVERGLVDGEYNARRAQCEAAARHYGVAALRDVDEAALDMGKAGLDPLTYRRARHVVTENARSTLAARALTSGDLVALGQLMAQSHLSMRDDFQITVPAVDALVETLQRAIGPNGGARMTGGGFGGAVVAIMPADKVESVKEGATRNYQTPGGQPPSVMICTPAAGTAHLQI